MLALPNRQNRVKRAPVPARHVLRADQRPVQRPQLMNARLKNLRPVVVVKADHIRLAQLNLRRLALLRRIAPVPAPHPTRQRLHRLLLARPRKHLRQQLIHALHLRRHIRRHIAAIVVRLVPHIPRQHARIIAERTHHALHISLQLRLDLRDPSAAPCPGSAPTPSYALPESADAAAPGADSSPSRNQTAPGSAEYDASPQSSETDPAAA